MLNPCDPPGAEGGEPVRVAGKGQFWPRSDGYLLELISLFDKACMGLSGAPSPETKMAESIEFRDFREAT